MIFIYTAACLAVIVLLFCVLVGYFVFSRYINFIIYSTAHTREDGLLKGEFDQDFLNIPKIEFTVQSEFGYPLSGIAIQGSSPDTIVFIHGVSWTWYGMVKYFTPFTERGWNIITCDLRGHGESGGSYPTYGYYEKHDLVKITDWALKYFPDTKLLGYFGESMGGAVMLQYLPLDERVDFAISDSAFSDMTHLAMYHIKGIKIPMVFTPVIIYFAGLFMKWKAGFTLKDVSPLRSIKSTTIPILFIHGMADPLVPHQMAREMYESRKPQFLSEIFLQEGADHSKSIMTDRAGYNKIIHEFIDFMSLLKKKREGA